MAANPFPLAYLPMASLASTGFISTAAQASSKVINPRPPPTQAAAVRFWSTSVFRGGHFALATMAVLRSRVQHSAR
jgi:hypothetical protein